MGDQNAVSTYKYGIDSLLPTAITGWVFNFLDDAPVVLELLVNDEFVGSFRADRVRADLTNMRADGGFAFALSPLGDDWRDFVAADAKVEVRIADTGEVIASTRWNGSRALGASGVCGLDGEARTLAKGTFVTPLRVRDDGWRAALLQDAATLARTAEQGGHLLAAAYGTLLGAVREGAMIGHDDDLDMMYISPASDMIAAVRDFHVLQEFLAGQGYEVRELSNGQAHVAASGALYPVDVFLAWFENGDQLSLTFTVKSGVAKSRVLPLTPVSIDGVELPAPKEPEYLLEAIYGPGWRVPDPAFEWRRPEHVAQYFAPIHNYSRGANADYWRSYYAYAGELAPPELPSQFALFALSYRGRPAYVVDLGCGSGRDSLFFGMNRIPTLGVDYAETAVKANAAKARDRGLDGSVAFVQVDVSDLDQVRGLLERVEAERGDRPVLVYSRFFFHAINDETEGAALLLISRLLQGAEDHAALEFRTRMDAQREKVTPSHYRRFIDVDAFLAKAREVYGLECEYRVEGTGYAVFKSDDAHVARLVFRKG